MTHTITAEQYARIVAETMVQTSERILDALEANGYVVLAREEDPIPETDPLEKYREFDGKLTDLLDAIHRASTRLSNSPESSAIWDEYRQNRLERKKR